MSKLQVDQLSKTSAGADTFVLPAADGTAGQYMKTDGSGALSFGTVAGGLAQFSQWRLTADFTGDAAPIASNLAEVATPVGFGKLPDEAAGGSNSMAESSGIFTFPSTGYWLIKFHFIFKANTVGIINSGRISTTIDNGTYANAAWSSIGLSAANHESGNTAEYIFDVTDTTQCKCRFDIDVTEAPCTTKGDTAENETSMTFIKLADT